MSSEIAYYSSFGSRGSGNGQFEYPGGLVIVGSSIFVCDTQNHRIQELTKTGLMVREFGNDFLSFPHSIYYDSAKLYVSDSANHRIVVYSLIGDLITYYGTQGSGEGELNYPTGIVTYGDYIFVVDQQNNRVQKLLKSTGQFISEINTDLSYPFGISTQNGQLYITQPHEVRTYNLEGVPDVDYSNAFNKLSQQLYPTGRAFWRPKESFFDKLHQGLSLSESRVQNDILNLQYDFFADSINMSQDAIEHWEFIYGISSNGTLSERLSVLEQRQSYPSNVFARQSRMFIEQQIRLSGFNVYLHSVFSSPTTAFYGMFQYGQKVYGQKASLFTIISNEVDSAKEIPFNIGNIGEKNVFYIGAETFGDYAEIGIEREKEFRELVLRLKPAHSVAILNINFI